MPCVGSQCHILDFTVEEEPEVDEAVNSLKNHNKKILRVK